MRACVAQGRSLPVLAAVVGAGLIACASSVVHAAVLIQSGFETPTDFASVVTQGGTSQVASSGGNPGGFADLRPGLGNIVQGFAGLESNTASYTVAHLPGGTFYLLQADVTFFSGLAGGELVPFLRQGSALLTPIGAGIPIGSGWTTTQVVAFALADFKDSNGNAPRFSIARVGFGVRIRGGPITEPPFAGRYGVDNVRLEVVPAPSGAVALIGVAALNLRRRRR